MAGIDKIYGTVKQYHEFKNWCKENKSEALKYFYNLYIDENSINSFGNSVKEQPITNFPTRIDMWLLKNCPITWVTERIKAQYNLDKED